MKSGTELGQFLRVFSPTLEPNGEFKVPSARRHPLGVHFCLQPTARIDSYSFKLVRAVDILSVAQPAVVLST